ncbi:MAG: AraC family transcriptional regulator ligand-binding domain-containing protein [Deltaproteobacteria bacterium]|nr:AraC family transcriptional regulator ligand-binding domain-containing protein [Deltaproteobacteria bacterium]
MASEMLPGVHALHLAELIEERFSVREGALFAGARLSRRDLERGARLTVADCEHFIARATALTHEPALAFFYGMQMRVSAHGYLGFAAMTARTLGEALDLAVRFAPTRTTAISLRLDRGPEDGEVALEILEHVDLGSAREAILVALLIGLWQIGNDLTGKELTGTAEMAIAPLAGFQRFAAVLPGETTFAAARTRLIFPRAILDLPLVRADVEAQRLARAQCERELDALFTPDDVARTRHALNHEDGAFRSEEEVARALAVSARTLKRRLAAQGTTFSELLDEARSQRAMTLLRGPHLGVEEVAAALGYSDAANFTRAFKRWTGRTPAAFRDHARP